MKAYLVQIDADDEFMERWTLCDRPTVVGRGVNADIRIPDISISRVHFEIAHRPTGWIIRDLKSKRGTWVNGSGINEALLRPHDRIRAGATQFVFEAEKTDGPQPPMRLHEGSAVPAVKEYKNMIRQLSHWNK